MEKYRIQYKIRTLAQLPEPFVFGEFGFSSYRKEFWDSDSWVAERIIETKNLNKALAIFKRELFPIIREISFVSQCAMFVGPNSILIYRETNNPEKYFFVQHIKNVGPVGLHFDGEEQNQLIALHSANVDKRWLFFLNESTNATTHFSRLALLIMCVDALSKDVKGKDRKLTENDARARVIGEELNKFLYQRTKGFRHDFFHGTLDVTTDDRNLDGLNEQLYKSITDYLSKEVGIGISDDVVDPQRTMDGNFEQLQCWCRFTEEILDIRQVEYSINSEKWSGVELLNTPPRSY